ncbi:MAG: hypothetical protein KatS3mg102_1619 [Planctomycetota bacterium]|nr:MAG: hypothetical protein KatS3mg102_1619 [Planctomycetota bacterium]
MRSRHWLAALGLLAALGIPRPAAAQSTTEWDTVRPPADAARVGEFRTPTTATWIRLTPWVGLGFSSDETTVGLASGNVLFGAELGFQPAELLTCFIRLGYGASFDRHFEPGAPFEGSADIDTKAIPFGLYVGLLNPELKAGAFRAIIGLGLQLFYLFDSGEQASFFDSSSGQTIAANIEFDDTLLFALSSFVRLQVEASAQFHLGLELFVHLPFYAMGDDVGELLADEFDFTGGVILEPAAYLSFLF